VDKYFGRIPKTYSPLPRVNVKEPARTHVSRFVEYNANVPLPAVVFTYLIPPASDIDSYALRIADTILSGGTSSRLYQSLVYQQQIAQEATSNAQLREDGGLFNFRVVLASDKKPEDGEKALLAEITRLQNGPRRKIRSLPIKCETLRPAMARLWHWATPPFYLVIQIALILISTASRK
jgi:zinc protease